MENNDNTKNRILLAALELFAEHGYDATSMRQIAELTGITKPAVYYHFPDKKSLFNGLLHFGMEHILNAIREIAQSDLPVLDKLKEIMWTRFKQFHRHQLHINRFVSDVFTGRMRCEINLDLRSMFADMNIQLQQVINEGITGGVFRSDLNVNHFICAFVGAQNILWHRTYIMGDGHIERQSVDQLVDMLYCGAKTR